MAVGHESHCEAKAVNHPQALDAAMRVLIGPEDGWDGHVMRVIELEEGGYSPRHTHSWPHINYVVEGVGTLFLNGEEIALQAGSFAFVPDDADHQFRNSGHGKMRFICIVPERGHF